jgi:TorA maturation chaperone TorD
MTNKDRERLLAEADIYRLLSLSFAYPDRETIENLHSITEDIVEVINSFSSDIQEKFLLYKNSLNGLSVKAAEEEFTELFMTRMLCPPYENSYGKSGVNKAGTLADINGFYKAFGLSISERDSDMPDHIAIELEFLSLVALKGAYGIEHSMGDMVEVCASAKNEFLKDHIGRWVGIFCKNLVRTTTKDFYRNLALLTSVFIEEEIKFYGINTEPAEGILCESSEPIDCSLLTGKKVKDN